MAGFAAHRRKVPWGTTDSFVPDGTSIHGAVDPAMNGWAIFGPAGGEEVRIQGWMAADSGQILRGDGFEGVSRFGGGNQRGFDG